MVALAASMRRRSSAASWSTTTAAPLTDAGLASIRRAAREDRPATWRRTASPPAARSRAGCFIADGTASRACSCTPRAPQTLRREIERHNRLYYVRGRARDSGRRVRRALPRAAGARGEHPELRTPDSPTQRVGARAAPRASPRSRTACRCCRSTNASTTEDVERVRPRACAKALGADADGRVRVRAQVRRPRGELRYEDGVFVRGATRGDGAVGEDVTPTCARSARSRCACAARSRRKLLEVRGEVLMFAARLRGAERARARRGREDVREPAQRRRRAGCASSTRASPRSGRSRSSPTASARRDGFDGAADARGAARRAATLGFPVATDAQRSCRASRACSTFYAARRAKRARRLPTTSTAWSTR